MGREGAADKDLLLASFLSHSRPLSSEPTSQSTLHRASQMHMTPELTPNYCWWQLQGARPLAFGTGRVTRSPGPGRPPSPLAGQRLRRCRWPNPVRIWTPGSSVIPALGFCSFTQVFRGLAKTDNRLLDSTGHPPHSPT